MRAGGRMMRLARAAGARFGPRVRGGTAYAAARARAVHLWLDAEPWIVEDGQAARYFGAALGKELARADCPDRTEGARLLRTALVVRQRIAEDAVRGAYVRATRQYVNFACGLDFFADRRGPSMDDMHVFELDSRRMLREKQRIRRSLGLANPTNTFACPVDLRNDDWWRVLLRRGFQPGQPAVFAWLGCTQYLQQTVVAEVLRVLDARCAPGTQVIFDFKVPLDLMPDGERTLIEQGMRRAAKRGEPWLSFFAPDTLHALLLAHGYSDIELVDAPRIQNCYLAGRSDGLVFPRFMNFALARTGDGAGHHVR